MNDWRRSYGFLLVATLAVVAAADFFFYGHAVGWTAALLTAGVFALLSFRDNRFIQTAGGRVFTLATIGLIFALVEQPTLLNVAYALVCLGAITMINSSGWEPDFWPWVVRFGRWLSTGWTRVFFDNSIAVRWLVRRGFSPALARGIAAWVLPAIMASGFVALFAWANPIISNWLARFFAWAGTAIEWLPGLLSVPRILFWMAFASVAWMILRGRSLRWRGAAAVPRAAAVADDPNAPTIESPIDIVIDPAPAGAPVGLVVRSLVLFNLVFAVENVLDVMFLYLNPDMDGTAYKTYVRRGAYPLVAAALLAGGFVLATFRPGSASERSPWARRLVYAWIGQTIFLTVSAAWRLHRYVDLTELTRLRVASIVWFCLVAAGLFYIVWRILAGRSNGWLINVNAVTALIVLYPCCFVNFDGMIATFNARHCAEAGGGGSPLDIEYYRTLGPTSVAALDSVKDRLPIAWRRERAEAVSHELHAQLESDLSDWRGWTWRRQRTARQIERMQLARGRAGGQVAHVAVPATP